MAEDFSFAWELREHGGAVCRVGDAGGGAAFVARRPADALADVLHGLCGLYGPLPGERFFFDGEPVEIRWVLRREGPDVDIAVYLFPDMRDSLGLPDTAGLLVWRSRQRRRRVVHAVLAAAQAVLEPPRDGSAPHPPFPAGPLRDLRRAHRREDGCGPGCAGAGAPRRRPSDRGRLPRG
ncbi:hypothetical protein [Nocardiopsis trehalosi]|jgi:hypothetical protein|uniref:hypothetical protein n=1 Tax=Nocardiopsis trehalosi TaxID=109329 RepID=UPI00082CCC62|nr:hypothetical protein [Nocardiopsis trehalosi]